MQNKAISSTGHLFMKFKTDDKPLVQAGTGCLLKRIGDTDKWIIITCAHNFVGNDSNGEIIPLNACMFLLQREGVKSFAASFKLVEGSEKLYD